MKAFPPERTAIVSGAASAIGIGRATAERLAQDGWALGLLDIDGEGVAAAATELSEKYGVKAAAVRVDVSDEAQVRAGIDELESQLPPLVGLANIAGISCPTPYLEMTTEEWKRVLDVNLNGVHYVTRRVAESLAKSGVGRIVTISSVSAQRGGGTYSKSAYTVSKAGVVGLTRALARELGPHGISVNAISPGPVDTEIMGGALTEERKAAMVADLVLDRVATPADVATSIAFLLSEPAGYITGQTLNVDGGLYMH